MLAWFQETALDLRDTAGETFRLRRDMPGEEFRLLFPLFLSLLAGKKSERVTFGRGNVFPQVLHVAGFFPAVYPYSTTESGQDPVQPDFPHLATGRQATGDMRCTLQTKNWLETSLDVAVMANATETLKPGAWIPTWAKMATDSLPLMQKELIRKIAWLNSRGIKSQKCISLNSLILLHSSVGKRVSRPKYVPVQAFQRKLCCGSQKKRWSNQMVESVDDLKTSQSNGKPRFPNFEMRRSRLLWRRASRTSYFKKRVNVEEGKAHMQDRFLRGRQIAFMIYEYFRVTGAHQAVLDYTDLFSISFHDNDIQDFDTRWDQAR